MPWYLQIILVLSEGTLIVSLATFFLYEEDLQHKQSKRTLRYHIMIFVSSILCFGICVLYTKNTDWVYKDAMSKYTKAKESLERFYEEHPEYKEE